MANRDLLKTIDKAKTMINPRYDLGARAWVELGDIARNEPLDGVSCAFLYGYAMGYRACKTESKSSAGERPPTERSDNDPNR